MQPQNRKLQTDKSPQNGRGVQNVGGDDNVSFNSQISYNDTSMMDTSGIGVIPQQKKQTFIQQTSKNQQISPSKQLVPQPPNDNFIHVSKCKNDKCPLQHLWKNQQYGNNNARNKDGEDFDQQFIPFFQCPKCISKPVKYCSQRCCQQDWFKQHQFECSGQQPNARDSVLLCQVQRIEQSTPFIKEGNDESSLTQEQLRLEQTFQNITKKDLDFVQSREANLGKGSYGEVQLAKHKQTGILVAIKKVEKKSLTSAKIKETLIREINIQKSLNHEYICRLYTSFEDNNTIYLALEYASKGNLFYLIRKERYLNEDTAFYFFIQVCSGIYYMHKQGLIHRDIKPENILIKEGNIIKICDFGWCVQSDHNQPRNTFCGTLEYMAPEMIQNKAHNHTLDVWSLGILLYELVHGRAPFTGAHPREISEKIMKGVIKFKQGVSDEYKDLVTQILKFEQSERIPLIMVFDHPWVKNFEKKYNLSKTAVAATTVSANDQEMEKKRAQLAAESKILAEAEEKKKLVEKEAAQKELERQQKIKQQQIEQEMLQKQQEERKKKDEELKKATLLASAALAESLLQKQKIEELEKQIQNKNQNSNKSLKEKETNIQKDQQQEPSPRENSEESRKKQLALLAIQQAQLKVEQERQEREKNIQQQNEIEKQQNNKQDRVFNSTISIRSSKKGTILSPVSPQLVSPSPFKNHKDQQTQEKENIKSPAVLILNEKGNKDNENIVQSNINQTKLATPQDFDKYESEFKVLDETDLNDISEYDDEEDNTVAGPVILVQQESAQEVKEEQPIEEERLEEEKESIQEEQENQMVSCVELDEQESEPISEEEEEYDSEMERESRRQERRINGIKKIDFGYESAASIQSDQKSQLLQQNEEEVKLPENKSFMQKLGGFLFFGCAGAGAKDTGKIKNQNNNES